jgi:hypothetical protein
MTMKKLSAYALLAVAMCLFCSCSTGVVSMGSDKYMVEVRGSSLSTKASNEAKCLELATGYCRERGLVMEVISTSGRNGLPVPFGHGGDCQLVFRAAKPATNLAPQLGGVQRAEGGTTLGQQLIDLQNAKTAGAISEAEFEAAKTRLLAK